MNREDDHNKTPVHAVPDVPGQDPRSAVLVEGKVFSRIPEDLYVPPDALRVFLDSFQGPLDLLLYLIRRQNLNILELPIAEIAAQYMQYIDKMREVRLELAGEYLVMAAMLAHIKSRMLLPRPPSDKEEEDPRAELVRRLLEYQRFKDAADKINVLPRVERDVAQVMVVAENLGDEKIWPEVRMEEIVAALQNVLTRVQLNRSHRVTREPLSVRDRMSGILSLTAENQFVELSDCFTLEEGRSGVVVSLLALLELVRSHAVEMIQAVTFGPIRIRRMR